MDQQLEMDQHLKDEAAAFDARITERVNAGFIPDLRRAVFCDYFYKSFWRDPLFIDLYLGRMHSTFMELLGRHAAPNAAILDVGCGAGYMSLELAREGFHVTAVDISSACIEQAKAVLSTNPYVEKFGSLSYRTCSMQDVSGEFDVIMFGGSLHHMDNLDEVMHSAKERLKPSGIILCYEPCHDQWKLSDAAQVVLIRGLLAQTGHWFEGDASLQNIQDESDLAVAISEIHSEYVNERDSNEAGQSPNDNSSTGAEVLSALRAHFNELEMRPGHSFIYRLLGGIRGSKAEIERLAKFVAAYDRYVVKQGFMNANGFYFIGRRT